MVLYENVTHFVEAEHRLQQAAKFAAIGEMAGSIAHEINTPLATISLLAGQITELLEESEGAETGENRAWVRDNAHQIEATVQRISKITRSMLSLARATQEVEPVQADLSRVVEDTLSFCSEKIRLAGVQLKVVQEERVLKARCHPAEVAQVLVNLLNNGLDSICRATLPEERAQHGIQIVLRRQENGEAEVRVSDTGPLVSEAVLPRLFHPYFTTKPVGQGTGLGLALSRRIMERQGGSLKFRQEQGTKAFVLQFPPLEPAVRTAS
jgi:C4-dicarboxylate-specific signal transduction histidine kinase